MGGISDLSPGNQYQLLGNDEQYTADVVRENGINKLYVKSSVTPATVDQLVYQEFSNGGSTDMNVNGSGTEVTFTVPAVASFDLIVTAIVIYGYDSGIKMDKFLSINELTNGLLIDVKSEDNNFEMLPIKTTQHFDARFAFGPGRSYEIVYAAGQDSLVARYTPPSPFVLRPTGTFGSDDFCNIVVRDNLSSVNNLKAIAEIVKVSV